MLFIHGQVLLAKPCAANAATTVARLQSNHRQRPFPFAPSNAPALQVPRQPERGSSSTHINNTQDSLGRSQPAQTRHSPSPRPAPPSLLILRYRSMNTSPPSKRLWARRSARSCLLGYGGSSSSLKHVFACGSLAMSYTLMIWKRLGPVAP